MAKQFLTGIDLNGNELIEAVIENVGALPDPANSRAGQFVTLTSVTPNVVYYFDGVTWEPTRTTGPASGDLEGNYPAPNLKEDIVTNREIAPGTVRTTELADGTIVHGDVNPANIDGLPGTPSLRTLGDGAQQATAGNDPRLSDTRTPTDGVVRDVHIAGDAAIAREKIANPLQDTSNGGFRITNVANGLNDDDVATVAQVNAARAGLDAKDSVRAATTAALGVTSTATVLTATQSGAIAVDGVALNVGDRVLVKDQADAIENGIYEVTVKGNTTTPFVLTRTEDADDAGELSIGSQTLVEGGAANGQQVWAVNNVDAEPWTPGSHNSFWTQIAGVSEVTAGNGLTRAAGNIINVLPGEGIIAEPDVLRIDPARIPRLVEGTLPAGQGSAVITHNLGKRGVMIQLYSNTAPYEQVEADILRTTSNTVTIAVGGVIPAGIGYVIHG